MKQRILILSYSPIGRDPRVMRQIDALHEEFEITVAGHAPAPDRPVYFHPIPCPPTPFLHKAYMACLLLLRLNKYFYWRQSAVRHTLESLRSARFDLVIANDIQALPVSLRLAGDAPVIFDGHEYAPKEFEESLWWRIFLQHYMTHLCDTYLPRVRASMTVCPTIAAEYKRQFGINPVFVPNCPAPEAIPVEETDSDRLRLIHHGAALQGRHLETMIEMLRYLDRRFSLDFMLVPSNPAYLSALKKRAAREPRISFREPVPLAEIVRTIHHYDIGVYILPPINFNSRYALPNKLFEFIQARLAVAIGPSPEMASLVRRLGVGVISPDFSPRSFAQALNALTTDDVSSMKQAADRAAKEWHAGTVCRSISALVNDALAGPPRAAAGPQ